jgi:hypothetical protein
MSARFSTTLAAPGVYLTTEPWVNSLFRATCSTVQGRDADLQFDFASLAFCPTVLPCP